jgi:hypothetical protein
MNINGGELCYDGNGGRRIQRAEIIVKIATDNEEENCIEELGNQMLR